MTDIFKLKLAILILISLNLVYLSRKSFLNMKAHGFFRLFAWESILISFLWNVQFWFRNPISPAQLMSWVLLGISGYLVISAVILLKRFGTPDPAREDVSLVGFEKTTRLVTKGTYRFIRHPLYSSLLFLSWGIFFKHPAFIPSVLSISATAFLLATARADEAESIRYFGPPYQEYMKRTKMFIPFVL